MKRALNTQLVIAALILASAAPSEAAPATLTVEVTKPSHAIMTLGYSEPEARSVLRVSLLPGTTPDAVAALAAALKRQLKNR